MSTPGACAASEQQLPYPQKPDLQNALIVSTVKTLAKAFISTQEKDQLVEKVGALDNQKFIRTYDRAYQTIRQYPRLMEQYGLKEHMRKEEFLQQLSSWDKNKMFSFIDALPDELIIAETRRYLARSESSQRHTDYISRICQIWDDVLGRFGMK